MSETYKQLSILDTLTFSQVDSRVNPTQSRESEKERRTNATSGQRCLELSESVNPPGSWARTYLGLLIGLTGWYSRRCALTWSLKGSRFNRLYFQLRVSPHAHTEETECGLLLTPTTIERAEDPKEMRRRAEEKGYKNGTKYNSLMSQIIYGNFLPTPVASDHHLRWPTENWKGDSDLPSVVNGTFGTRSQLNPLFVEEMMGFPESWTLSPFLNGERKQSKPTETP